MSLGSPKSAEKKKFVPNFNVARVKREPEESKVVVKKEGAGAKQKKRQEQKKEKKDKINSDESRLTTLSKLKRLDMDLP